MSDEHAKNLAAAQEETFSDRSAVASGVNAAALSAGAGLIVSAVQTSLGKHNQGAMGVLSRYGGTIALFTAMGGAFAFTDAAVANSRQKDDPYNGAAGGCAAGLVAGAQARSLPMMAGACIGMAALVGTFDAAGKSLAGNSPLPIAQAGGAHGEKPSAPARPGSTAWREEKERRRLAFFKKPAEVDHE